MFLNEDDTQMPASDATAPAADTTAPEEVHHEEAPADDTAEQATPAADESAAM